MANRDYGKAKSSGTGYHKSVMKLADGGPVDEDQMKQAGLDASKDEKVGFFERLKAGNIDDPKSEAYSRWGAGRGRIDAGNKAQGQNDIDMAESLSRDTPKQEEPTPAAAPEKDDYEDRIAARAASTYKQESAPATRTKTAVAKPVAKASSAGRSIVDGGGADDDTPKKPTPSTSNYGNEGRGKAVTRASMDSRINDEFDSAPLNRAVKAAAKSLTSGISSMGDMVGVRKGNNSNRYYGLTGKRLTAEDDPRVIKGKN